LNGKSNTIPFSRTVSLSTRCYCYDYSQLKK
jgi:hypothetical protein